MARNNPLRRWLGLAAPTKLLCWQHAPRCGDDTNIPPLAVAAERLTVLRLRYACQRVRMALGLGACGSMAGCLSGPCISQNICLAARAPGLLLGHALDLDLFALAPNKPLREPARGSASTSSWHKQPRRLGALQLQPRKTDAGILGAKKPAGI